MPHRRGEGAGEHREQHLAARQVREGAELPRVEQRAVEHAAFDDEGGRATSRSPGAPWRPRSRRRGRRRWPSAPRAARSAARGRCPRSARRTRVFLNTL